MDLAKLRLSPTEMDLVLNADWILTKNDIIDKVKQSFSQLSNSIENKSLPSTPKISKGENYQGLPYLILDYPRVFEKENVFAIRTMFWWGKFFSLTLQLAGEYKTKHQSAIINNTAKWKENNFHYCVNEDPWQHHFGADNYILIDEKFEERLPKHSFIKIAKRYNLSIWETSLREIEKDHLILQSILTHDF